MIKPVLSHPKTAEVRGRNAVIATGSVVVKNIPRNCLAVGYPAKVKLELSLSINFLAKSADIIKVSHSEYIF